MSKRGMIKVTGNLIVGALTLILVLLILGRVINFLTGGNSAENTLDSTKMLVEIINTMNKNDKISQVLTINRGSVIAGFSSGEGIEFKKSSWFHIFHQNRIVKHPETGVCTDVDTCICACTTKDYCDNNMGQCYALNSTIKNIYINGTNAGINLGTGVPSRKDAYYMVLATTRLASHQVRINITRDENTIWIAILGVGGT